MNDRFRVPGVELGRVTCRCGCHNTCHLCKRRGFSPMVDGIDYDSSEQ